jgi:hypothetical protein
MARLKGTVHLQILFPSVARHSRTRRVLATSSVNLIDHDSFIGFCVPRIMDSSFYLTPVARSLEQARRSGTRLMSHIWMLRTITLPPNLTTSQYLSQALDENLFKLE